MTENSLKNITPDSLTGMIFALEGVKNTIVLLNGPMGCKFYHSTTSQYLVPRPPLYLPLKEGEKPVEVSGNFLNEWFFRQPQVPCTWLDSHDYVYGTKEKVRAALEYIKKYIEFDLLAVVNSPGASLIGDDPREMCDEIFPDKLTVVLESPGYSTEYYDGNQTAILELLKQVGKKLWDSHEKKKNSVPTVNILGISVWQKYAEGNRDEIKRLLELCGIKVNCILCAGCTADEIKAIPDADLNIVLYPEMGKEAALWLKDELGMPCYICEKPPIGFDASEEFFKDICSILNADPKPVLLESEKARSVAWYRISNIYALSGLPNGTTYALKSFPSEEAAYEAFFTDYLGMIRDCSDIENTEAELVFADANTIAELILKDKKFCGIEIANPTMGYVDVIPKKTLGIQGALFLIELVLNSFMNRSV